MAGKRTLVTGAAGFLGSYLLEGLAAGGDIVLALDRHLPQVSHPGITPVVGDVADQQLLGELMDGVQEVYHLAAVAEIAESKKDPLATLDTNIMGTARCLHVAQNAGVERFIFASSVYVGGTMGSFYGVSKKVGETLCRTFAAEYGLPYTICRYGSLYGRRANRWNMIYRLCRSMVQGRQFEFWGNGEEIREFIHIRDAARETVRVARDPAFVNTAVLITGHQRMKIRDFFAMLEEIVGRKGMVICRDEQNHQHYKITPYCFSPEMPFRINMGSFIDISEGILDCLKEASEEMNEATD